MQRKSPRASSLASSEGAPLAPSRRRALRGEHTVLAGYQRCFPVNRETSQHPVPRSDLRMSPLTSVGRGIPALPEAVLGLPEQLPLCFLPPAGSMSSHKGLNGTCSVHEYTGTFAGQTVRFKMTSVCGHVMTLDFLGEPPTRPPTHPIEGSPARCFPGSSWNWERGAPGRNVQTRES